MQEVVGIIRKNAAAYSIPLFHYTPSQLKKQITGFGRAEKIDIQEAMQQLLGLPELPQPDHAADALAAAYVYLDSNNLITNTAA